jgi:hypothetical protein
MSRKNHGTEDLNKILTDPSKKYNLNHKKVTDMDDDSIGSSEDMASMKRVVK